MYDTLLMNYRKISFIVPDDIILQRLADTLCRI